MEAKAKWSNEAIKFKGKFISHPPKIQQAIFLNCHHTQMLKNCQKYKLDADKQEFSDQQTTEAIKKARPS